MDFDLIVVGGGPVGLAMARAARGPLGDTRVALLAQEAPAPPPAGALDARVYALSPGNVAFLRHLRAWDLLDPSRLTPVHRMRVFGDAAGGCIEFDAYRAGVPELAWTVEDAALQEALWRSVQGREALQVFAGAHCEALRQEERAAAVRLRDGRELTAALVVAADGANSVVRRQAAIAFSSREYGQSAVVANFACEREHENTACQWFQGGPVLALLPLPGRRVSMIWSLPTEEARRVEELEATELCRRVTAASEGRLGELSLVTPARSYPLRRLAARRLIANRVALVGDAAHVVHPLAGQGLNLGLQDVRELAAVLAARPSVRDAGDPGLLRRYERARTESILAMDFVVDGLYRLFSADNRATGRLRNAGLNLANRMQVIKNILIRQAMA